LANAFVRTSEAELLKALKDLQSKTVSGRLRGLIFDLRNNSGGLLDQGIKIADMFLRKGRIVTVKERSREDENHAAHSPGTFDMPMVVLVNAGSASASEIVASALQDNARALVVGDRTFGKASVQRLFQPPWRDDFYIKLTVARYYSPVGRTIQVVGVMPDLEVPPKVGGKMPLGWREENLSNYLDPIANNYESPNKAVADIVKKCAGKRGIAEKIHSADPNPQVKYDYQLMKGADYLECLVDYRAGTTAGSEE
jgi:C-terminal peptidase prc